MVEPKLSENENWIISPGTVVEDVSGVDSMSALPPALEDASALEVWPCRIWN